MKRLTTIICLLALGLGTLSLWGAERLPLASVNVGKLTNELQSSTDGKNGMNIVWWIPGEFWSATLLADPGVPDAAAKELIARLEPYAILAVVRGDISETPTFYDSKTVGANLVVTYKDAAGKAVNLKPNAKPDAQVTTLIDQMKPLLTAAMGQAGQNMHFFVFDDRNAAGKRIVSPYEKGQLTVELKALPKEDGGKVTFDMPLDSLFQPRICPNCSHKADVAWTFCPFCGKELAQ